MQGSVRKRGSTWGYYFDLGIVDGKRKKKEKGGFRTKKECEVALRSAMGDYENSNFIGKKVLFRDFVSDWLENYVKPLRKASTYDRYKGLYKKYLSTINDMSLDKVTNMHIEKILSNHRGKVSNTTLQGVYTLTNSIFSRAYKLKIIKENPCDFVERPQRENFTADTLSIEEIGVLYNALDPTNEYDFMFMVALDITLELGLRRGELSGLEWTNLDYENNMVGIVNNVVYTNGHIVIGTPKTQDSFRNLYVSDRLLDTLEDLKGIRPNTTKIMCWSNGKSIHPLWYSTKMAKVIKKCGISKHIRFHDLRHTNATLMLSQGVDFKTMQTRLGHKDINTTLNIYSHVNKEMQKNATEKLNNLLGGKWVAK